MTCITKQHVGKHTYLYESTSFRDELGRPRNKKVRIGKLDLETGEPIYDPEYLARKDNACNTGATSSKREDSSCNTDDVSLKDKSRAIVESAPHHEKLIPQYDIVLNELMPGSASNSDEVKALKDEVGSLKSQLAEAISLLKEKAKQTN